MEVIFEVGSQWKSRCGSRCVIVKIDQNDHTMLVYHDKGEDDDPVFYWHDLDDGTWYDPTRAQWDEIEDDLIEEWS